MSGNMLLAGTARELRLGAEACDTSEVHVWALRVPGGLPESSLDLSVLDEEERRRMAAFLHSRDRAVYAFAHVALRGVLSGLTGVAPQALRFTRAPCPCCREPHGRPVLESASPEFSLSHSRDLVLIGVAPVAIGVDAEPVPESEVAEQIAQLLHPAEREEVEAAAPEDRPAAFARLWARKEAYLKGLGTGLGRDLAADDVRGDLPGWRLTDLPPAAGCAAAVAVNSPDPRAVRVHRSL